MEEPIPVSLLIKYLEGELPLPERKRLEELLLKNPDYFKILKGLSELEDKLGAGNLEHFLEIRQRRMKKKIFGEK